MNKLEFIQVLDSGNEVVSDKTAELWYHILKWIQTRGYADTADSPDFVRYVQAFRPVEVATIGRHLGRMATAGFLQAHTLHRKLSKEATTEMATSISGMVFGWDSSTLPPSFKRYTLPDTACPLDFKAASLMLDRNRQRDSELRAQGVCSDPT